MRVMTHYLFIPLVLLLSACDRTSDVTQEEAGTPEPQGYVETGDLPKLRDHGALRLIAPRFDGAALPREGIPVQDYQRIAEEFTNSLGLDVQWVYVDSFTDLLPTLMAGGGDLVVTNLTQTEARAEQVAFSRPLHTVDEVIVGPKNLPLDNLVAMGDVTITVPEGSSFAESLESYNADADTPLHYETIPATGGSADVLANIAEGNYQATVLDSNMAQQLVGNYSNLTVGATLRENRPMGWAVRQDNPQLLKALNEYLVSHFLSSATYEVEARDWAAIKDHGRIRMLTLNNPASYFMWRGELMGFDYDLAKEFAKQHELHLSVVLKDSIPALFDALRNGEGDFIAASITKTEERATGEVVFSRPYLKVTEQLINRKGQPKIEEVDALAGKTVGVNPDTVFYERLKELQSVGIDLELVEYPGIMTEELFQRLADQEFDFMIADSHLVAMEQAYNDDIQVALDLGGESGIAWAMRDSQEQLLQKLNAFIQEEYRGLFYNVTFNKYFKNERKSRSLQEERITSGSELSPYDDIVKEVAAKYNMDWRLIVAQMYQESRFDPKAKSFAGAQGLMQLMPRTARELGFKNITKPKNGIEAGVAYLDWLEDRFPGNIEFEERIFFQLAAYNAGAGHVRDARRLARRQGLDPNQWFDHVEQAMLLLAKPEHYQNARFGYVRGSEPVEYVRSIRGRYLAYLGASQ